MPTRNKNKCPIDYSTTVDDKNTNCDSDWIGKPTTDSTCPQRDLVHYEERERCVIIDDGTNCCHRPEPRSRLLSPVFPIKPKERKKRKKGKPIDNESIEGETKGRVQSPGQIENVGSPITRKSNSSSQKPRPKSTSSSRKFPPGTKQSQDIVYLHKSRTRSKINWKKAPKYPVKHTATTKLRNEYWFADCGKLRVKAYRGDWANFPSDLAHDYELYENYFKYRKQAIRGGSVKKIIPSKSPKPSKLFRKRSPVKAPSTSKPKKKKIRINLAYLRKRRARFDLSKKPKIEVKHTITTTLRKSSDAGSCQKSDTPTLWHGSSAELEQLKRTIYQRRENMRTTWKTKTEDFDSTQPTTEPSTMKVQSTRISTNRKTGTTNITSRQMSRCKSKNCQNDSMNNLIVLSKPSTVDNCSPKHTDKTRRQKPTDKVPPKKLVSISGNLSPKIPPRINRAGFKTTANPCSGMRWVLPPTIPIRQSLTATVRQKNTNLLQNHHKQTR